MRDLVKSREMPSPRKLILPVFFTSLNWVWDMRERERERERERGKEREREIERRETDRQMELS